MPCTSPERAGGDPRRSVRVSKLFERAREVLLRILESAGRSNKTVSSQQINAFYKSNRSQHTGVNLPDRIYGKSVGQDGTLWLEGANSGSLVGGRLLKTVKDYEACERILAQIDPKYFQDELFVFFDENGSMRCPQSQQLKDLCALAMR